MKKEIRNRKREPAGPSKMAKPLNPGKLPDEIDPNTKSPLGLYLKLNGLSLNGFCRAMGCDYRSVQAWANGSQEPSIPYALEIERITKGVVAIETWAGLPSVTEKIAQIRAKQEDGVQRIRNENEPGGFAQPMKALKKGGLHPERRFKRGAAEAESEEADDQER